MKKDFVKGIAVGCALSIAIGGASALADTYRKFLEGSMNMLLRANCNDNDG